MRMKNVIYRNGIVGERALAQCENVRTTIMYHPRTHSHVVTAFTLRCACHVLREYNDEIFAKLSNRRKDHLLH